MNLYNYCASDPVNFIDPSGHVAIQLIYVGIIGVGVITLAYAIDQYNKIPEVKKATDSFVSDVGKGAKAVSKALAKEIVKAYNKAKQKSKKDKYEKHHIVAKKAKGAKYARKILTKKTVKIGINSKANLVSIKYNLHKHLHTKAYYKRVNNVLRKSNGSYKNATKKKTMRGLNLIKTYLKAASARTP